MSIIEDRVKYLNRLLNTGFYVYSVDPPYASHYQTVKLHGVRPLTHSEQGVLRQMQIGNHVQVWNISWDGTWVVLGVATGFPWYPRKKTFGWLKAWYNAKKYSFR